MKKIITICIVAAMAFACKDKHVNPPIYKDRAEVETIGEAQNAINHGSSEIIITSALTENGSLVIPKTYVADNKVVTVEVPAGGKNFSITEGTGSKNYPELKLKVTDAKDLDINLPDMSVIFDGRVTGTMKASTAANTLTIAPTAVINILNVQKGNVRLLGTVTTFGTVAMNSNVLYPVASVSELFNRTNVIGYNNITNGGVFLTADMDNIIPADGTLGGITQIHKNLFAFSIGVDPSLNPTLSWDGFVFDGNGYTLSGAAYDNVMIVFANNVTVKDLTITQTAANKAVEIEKGGVLVPANNNGISVHRSLNVSLINVNTHDCGKYGAVVNGSEVTATNFKSSANGWGGINVGQGVGVTEVPKLTLVSGTITDKSAIVVDKNDIPTAIVVVPTGWTNKIEDVTGHKIYSPAK